MGLFDIFSGDDAKKAAADKVAGLNAGYSQASDLLGAGRDALTSNFGAAGDLYKNLLTSYAPGASAYGDATGANGAAGYARARSNFQTNPGYQFQMDQGLQALNRTHAAAGNLSSGNADTDALKYATGLADQSYGQYIAGLSPYLGGQQTATAGAAGVDTGLGTNLNASYGNQAGLGYQTQVGIGNANAAGDMADYNASANLWGGLLNGAKAITGSGGLFGSGGLVPGIKGLFPGA
ncbi:MAG TPA: hypothetical protein VGR76_07140 [Candidatus Angelobacter sp.]|nr:hypothetical protein [Candidatus Angelobacter sp.]